MSYKRTTRLGLAGLLAVVAMTMAASTAFGYSEFKVGSGGKFPITFHGLGGLTTFTSEKGTTIMCSHSLTSGTILSSTLVDVKTKYSGDCLIEKTPLKFEEGAECSSTIETEELNAEPITITGHLSSNRGVLILPGKSGGSIAKFSCGKVAVTVKGALICEDEPNTGKPSTTSHVVCAQTAKTANSYIRRGKLWAATSLACR